MNLKILSACLVVNLVACNVLGAAWVAAQEANSASSQTSDAANPLAESQQAVAVRFARLEDLLLRSAELEAGENPTRAALLQQAVQLSKQAQLSGLLADAASNLERKQYSDAIEQQKSSREALKRLLELLQLENREERVREKRDQVRRWIEETDRLLRLQSSLRGRTEGGADSEQAASDQDKLANKAKDIVDDLRGEEQSTRESESNSRDPEDSSDTPEKNPKETSEKDPSEKDPSEKDPSEKDPSGKDSSNSESDEPSEGQPSDSQSDSPPDSETPAADQPGDPAKDQKPSGQQQPSSESPQPGSNGDEPAAEQPAESQDPTERARQRIEQAQQRMREAQQQLEQAERDGAVEKQLEAEDKLREAIEELEEILRQLREEEIERSLASLETRLRRMLEMQTKVLEESKRLQEISGEQSVRQIEIRASSLARDEQKILAEGERAFLLLRDEGSSAAFPEAIEQVNSDINTVAERLAAADVGPLTIVIEEEVVSSLEEMVQALVQVQKDNQKKQQQQQSGQPQQGQPGDQPLVDKLAELRLIRTLQIRINNRTDALSKMLSDPADLVGQVSEGEVLEQLRELAERQASIQAVTHNIDIGKGE
ncbi:MAG: hypothetical protein R3C53_18245 [Pirellulaceae bacterium]